MKYYRVEAKCGHVGRNNYIIKDFYIKAENGKEAANKTRYISRVKHHQKDAIVSLMEITREEYLGGFEKHKIDGYFLAHSKQEQKTLCSYDNLNILKEKDKLTYKKNKNVKKLLLEQLYRREWNCMKELAYE